MRKLVVAGGLLIAGLFVIGIIFTPAGVSWGYGPGWGYGYGYGRGTAWGPGRATGPMHFDPSSLQTISGKVISLETVGGFGPRGMRALNVESEGRTLTVFLGPDFYITDEKLPVKAGDEVTVEAAETTYGLKSLFVAKSVTVAGKTLALRDEAGFPLWRGQGRFAVGQAGFGCAGYRRGWGMGRGPGRMGYGFGRGPGWMVPPTQ